MSDTNSMMNAEEFAAFLNKNGVTANDIYKRDELIRKEAKRDFMKAYESLIEALTDVDPHNALAGS